MSDKNFWPTDNRLGELRREGIFPFSRVAVSASVLAAVVLSLYAIHARLDKLWNIFSDCFSGNKKQCMLFTDFTLLQEMIAEIFLVLTLPLIYALIAVGLCGFLQTRFYFSLRELAFSPGRLVPKIDIKPFLLIKRLVTAVSGGIVILFVLLVGLYFLLGPVLTLFHLDLRAFEQVADIFRILLPFLVVFALALAIVSYFISRLFFMLEHRMTAEELKSEGELEF